MCACVEFEKALWTNDTFLRVAFGLSREMSTGEMKWDKGRILNQRSHSRMETIGPALNSGFSV